MKRLGSVVAKNNHVIVLKLQQTEKCAGCPANCNKPLFDLFSLHRKLFIINDTNKHYELIDANGLMGGRVQLEQLIHVKINQKDLMISSAWMYLLPLIICLISVIVGHYLGLFIAMSSDLTSLLGLFMGFGLSFIILNKINTAEHLKIRPKVTIL